MGYESYTDRVRREQEEEFRLRVGNQLNVDYNRATEVLRLKGATGLPEQVIDSDFDNISELVRQREFDPDYYKETAPVWRQFASENPFDQSVLEYNKQWMTQYEEAYRELDSTSWSDWAFSHVFDAMRWGTAPTRNSWTSSWASRRMMEIGNQAALSGGYTPEQQEQMEELRRYAVSHDFGAEWSKPIVWLTSQSANLIGSMEQRFIRGVQLGTVGAGIGGMYGSAGGTFILPGGMTAVGGAGGAAGGWTIGFTAGMFIGGYEFGTELGRGEAYNEYRELGFSHADAAWAAEISGNISGVLEATLGQVFFDKLPGVRTLKGTASQQIVKQLMGKESFRQVAGRAVFDYGAGLTSEVVTEILQESALITMGEVLKMRDPTIAERLTGEQIADRIAEITIETLKSTFLIAGAGPGGRLFLDGRRARNAQNFSTVLKQAAEGVQNADIRKTLPKVWQNFIDRVHKSGDAEHVGMPFREFAGYFSSKGVELADAAKELGITNLEEAQVNGVDVQIPLKAFAEKIAANSETFNQMMPHLRPDDDSMTLREAEQYYQRQEEFMGILEEYGAKIRDTEQDADIEAIVSDVQGDLVAAGFDEFSAGQLAKVMRGIGIMAQREGLDPIPIFKQIWGGIKRDEDGAATAPADISATVDPLLNMLREGKVPTQRDMYGPSLMDFVVAQGGIDVGDPELVAMDFELGAQELGISKAKLARWKRGGKDISHIAEIAAEAGYLPARDENLLIDALREEVAGRPVYGQREGGDVRMRDLSVTLDELAGILEEAHIDLDEMTNAQVRDALSKRQTLAQIDTKELRDLTAIVMQQIMTAEERASLSGPFEGAMTVDTILSQAAAMLPLVDETQDFGDVKLPAEDMTIQGTRDTAKVRRSAQVEFRQAVKRKNVIKRLLDCVSG